MLISIAKHIIIFFNDKVNSSMNKLVRKSHTAVMPIANTCNIGYPHDGRADNMDRRADKRHYQHDHRSADKLLL